MKSPCETTLDDTVSTAVTTGRTYNKHAEQRAIRISERWNLPYYPRQGRSLSSVRQAAEHDGMTDPRLIVVEHDRLTLHFEDGATFYYHPGMGFNRLKRVMDGAHDWMIDAMGLRPGDRVLDATVGLGSDLVVSSFVVGENGVAVGLESERDIALIVSEGMRTYTHEHSDALTESLRRIEIIHTNYDDFLAQAEPKSFDVIYFDPMFVDPVEQSQQMIPLRKLANKVPLSAESFQSALRVAKRRVVVKDRVRGPYATSDWFETYVGGRGSRIVFCIADARG